jgi:Clp amino terminal domain, pathogenicity island component
MDDAVRELIDAGENLVLAMASLLEAQHRATQDAPYQLLFETAGDVTRHYTAWEQARARWKEARRAAGDEREPREIMESLAGPVFRPAGRPPGTMRSGSAQVGSTRFDKFTVRARKVLQLAQEEAQRLNHNYIGTEHFLLGLVREGEGVAAKVLVSLGIDLDRAREAVEFIIGRGEHVPSGEIGLTPRAKRVIELAVDEARRLDHHYIGTEHLLLGLLREGEGIGAQMLARHGVDRDAVLAGRT